MVATMFGSLIVHARAIEVAEAGGGPLAEAAKRSAVAGCSQPPWSASHSGRREVVEGDDRVDAALAAAPRTSAR